MDTNKKNKTLEYINKKRSESNQSVTTETEIAEILKEQFFKDQYIAMKINEAKEAAELELEG